MLQYPTTRGTPHDDALPRARGLAPRQREDHLEGARRALRGDRDRRGAGHLGLTHERGQYQVMSLREASSGRLTVRAPRGARPDRR